MDDEDRYTRITLRIPKDLDRKLQASADATSKSKNAEIIARLQQTFDESVAGAPMPPDTKKLDYDAALRSLLKNDEFRSKLQEALVDLAYSLVKDSKAPSTAALREIAIQGPPSEDPFIRAEQVKRGLVPDFPKK